MMELTEVDTLTLVLGQRKDSIYIYGCLEILDFLNETDKNTVMTCGFAD